MGGHVFGVVARRLTTAQHAALYEYAKTRLQPFTEFKIASLYTAASKTTHGDLDILMGNWVEGEGFKTNFAVDDASVDKSNLLESSHWREVGAREGHQWSGQDVTEWAKAVAITLGARSWQNHQHGVSLAVPCDVIGDLVANAESDEFFQIDIRMIRPDRFEFAVFIMSYGITALLRAQALRCLSLALMIRHEHLVVRHCPFPGLTPIEVELTCNVVQFLEWLGLDYDQWQNGFELQYDYYRWVAGGAHDPDGRIPSDHMKLIHQAWRRFITSGDDIPKVKTRHQPARRQEMELFKGYLRVLYRMSNNSPDLRSVSTRPGTSGTAPTTTAFTVITRTSFRVDHATGKTTELSADTKIEDHVPQSDEKSNPALDPKCPIPLDDFAVQALRHFGKKEEYDQQVMNQSGEANRLYERQRRRAQNREFSNKHEDPAARTGKAMVGQSR